jgi:hypothetical protein
MSATPNDNGAKGQTTLDGFKPPKLEVGDHVEDKDEHVDATMLVVGVTAKTAENYDIDADSTVADANPDYPADDKVVEVVFPHSGALELDTDATYAYPRSRLVLKESIHG